MDISTFFIIVVLIMVICALGNLIMWVSDNGISLVLSAVLFVVVLFFMVMASGIAGKQKNGEPAATTFAVIETYTPADGSFDYCHYIDKGVLDIRAEEWALEIPDGEYEYCSGDYRVELCRETKEYKYWFVKETVIEEYYKVYVPA